MGRTDRHMVGILGTWWRHMFATWHGRWVSCEVAKKLKQRYYMYYTTSTIGASSWVGSIFFSLSFFFVGAECCLLEGGYRVFDSRCMAVKPLLELPRGGFLRVGP